jgi:hypothetical protein
MFGKGFDIYLLFKQRCGYACIFPSPSFIERVKPFIVDQTVDAVASITAKDLLLPFDIIIHRFPVREFQQTMITLTHGR